MATSKYDLTAPRRSDSDGEVTQRRKAICRRITMVAKHRFARFGYEQISMVDVARSADVRWDEFLLYYDDKGALLEAILDEGWKRLLPHLSELAFTSVTAHTALLSILAAMTNLVQEDEDFVRLLLIEGRLPDPETGELECSKGYGKFRELCRDLLVRGQRDGSFRQALQPQVVSSLIIGALEGLLRDRLLSEQSGSVTPYSGISVISSYDVLVSALKA